MRIVCPSCGAAYEVPPDRLAPGRLVRCARCTADWAPLEPEPEAEPAPEPKPERPRLEERLPPPALPPPPLPEPPPPEPPPLVAPPRDERLASPVPEPARAGGRALAAAWVLSAVVLGAAAWGAYQWREDVVRAWPASERAYAALGIAPKQ